MRIGILAYEGCLGGEVFGFADVLQFANRAAQAREPDQPGPFAVSLIGVRAGPVQAATGGALNVELAREDFDLVVTPGFDFQDLSVLPQRMAGLADEAALLAKLAGRSPVASICVGSFLLGEAGLLDGRKCTTAWLFAPELARRYPGAQVEPEALIVEDGGMTTTGAFSASHDLALKVIGENAGEGLARAIGRMALLENNRVSQAAYVDAQMLRNLRPPFARAVRRRLEAEIGRPYDLGALAGALNVSTRTLLRRFKAETGRTPLEELQALRVGRAKRLLESTRLGLGEIAAEVGYQDPATFARLFARLAAMTPAAYRRRFTARVG